MNSKHINHENIIIGAGPAGLQLGYFFKRANIPYVILERNEKAASFFQKYPLSGKLISINKKHVGVNKPADFALRHDWNSLLSDKNHLFTDYSNDYYPDHEDIVKYMNDFAAKNALNIIYNADVQRVKKHPENGTYLLGVEIKQADKPEPKRSVYTCTKLIVATGLSLPVRPESIINNAKTPIKHYADFEKDFFKKQENLDTYKNKSLLIIGNGNAAYELGNLLNPYCSTIAIAGRRPKPWAMSTHYTGDLRAVYLPLYDTFLLKSLNGFDYGTEQFVVNQETPTSKYEILYYCRDENCAVRHKYLDNTIDGFDHVIVSTGWKFDGGIFDFDIDLTQPGTKYPAITSRYESTNNTNLYFIGSLMHSMDYKKSSGGFIHGFRYLIEYFVNLNYTGAYNVSKFSTEGKDPLQPLVNHVIDKINNTSALYQMYGQICDLFYEDQQTNTIVYYNNVHMNKYLFDMDPLPPNTHVFMLSLEYGNKKHITDIYELGVRVSGLGNENDATLLHPVLRVFKEMEDDHKILVDAFHFDEDLFANFTFKDKYGEKLSRILRMFIETT